MKTEQPGKGKDYFKDLKPFNKKLMAKMKKRGYVFYRPAKKEEKDEGEK